MPRGRGRINRADAAEVFPRQVRGITFHLRDWKEIRMPHGKHRGCNLCPTEFTLETPEDCWQPFPPWKLWLPEQLKANDLVMKCDQQFPVSTAIHDFFRNQLGSSPSQKWTGELQRHWVGYVANVEKLLQEMITSRRLRMPPWMVQQLPQYYDPSIFAQPTLERTAAPFPVNHPGNQALTHRPRGQQMTMPHEGIQQNFAACETLQTQAAGPSRASGYRHFRPRYEAPYRRFLPSQRSLPTLMPVQNVQHQPPQQRFVARPSCTDACHDSEQPSTADALWTSGTLLDVQKQQLDQHSVIESETAHEGQEAPNNTEVQMMDTDFQELQHLIGADTNDDNMYIATDLTRRLNEGLQREPTPKEEDDEDMYYLFDGEYEESQESPEEASEEDDEIYALLNPASAK